ncbi:hypothetical protein C1J03_10060 [Sulfitobacter sp. SK012]|uniref:endonuclease NucS domain-containing protein n=1 Tax=Sulfitobacter sp. SK012 TaxID=1389005 RepID=UPI000E0B377E|nr:endonuclease NucS domain-containing protein [Sulfitobacter sp. SK012]AXI46338.1 hypothetical protein C1J03_10060 [Sulfitobacter sp. SK012]
MTKLELPNGILLEEIEEGLLVQQGTEAYVARNWCLSAPVIELVEAAMVAGLNWMIRTDHPRRNARWPNRRGVVYLAFSPSEHQQWALAIDTFRPVSGEFGHGVFNGKYHEQFVKLGLPFTFEKRNKGAGHLVVAREHVLPTLAALREFEHQVLDLGRTERSHAGFATEYEIQRAILNHWAETPFARRHVIVQDEYPVDGGLNSRRIDVLAQDPKLGDWLVIEIKRAEANIDAVRQVEDYLLALGQKDAFAFGKLEGVLIAERISAAVREAALHAGIAAYEMEWPSALRRVA